MTQVTINNETTTFASVRAALMFTRDIIRNARRIYRKAHNLTDNVHELPPAERTGYDLVDMASYKLSNMGAEQLCKLLNDYGISAKIESKDKVITIYQVNTYEAYRADEQGKRWTKEIPQDTICYEHEMLNSLQVQIPANIGYFDVLTDDDGSALIANADHVWKVKDGEDNICVLEDYD